MTGVSATFTYMYRYLKQYPFNFLHNYRYLKNMHKPDKEGLLRRCQKKAGQFARRPQQSDGV